MIEIGKNYDLEHRLRVEAEILGIIMTSNQESEIVEIIFNQNLSLKDFYSPLHRGIYEAILTCIEKVAYPSIVNVGQFRPDVFRLNNFKEFEDYLVHTMHLGMVAPVNLSHAMFILKQYVLMDFWNKNAQDVLYGNWNGRDVIQVGDTIVNEYKTIWGRMTERLKIETEGAYENEIRIKVAKRLKGQAIGVSTTVDIIDDFITAYSPGELVIIAGRPGMGKTTYALISAWNTSKLGNAVIFFSLEMPKNQLKSKIISLETGIDYHRIKSGDITSEELKRVIECDKYIENSNFHILDKIKTIEEISKKTEEYVKKHDIKIIFIDYLQRTKTLEKGKIREEITTISRECKSIAKDNYIPVIALSQLSRAVESRFNKRPLLSDLKESGSIEEDADIVAFLYRQAYYDQMKQGPTIPYSELFHTEFIVAKGRDLGTKTIHLFIDAIKMTIDEYSFSGTYNELIPTPAPPVPKNNLTIDKPKNDGKQEIPF